jgi:hypothetical protein
MFGLRADRDFVGSLVGPESEFAGVPLTVDEEREMARRQRVQLGLGPLKDLLWSTPTFGGLYIDQAGGGILDVALTAVPEGGLIAAIGAAAPDEAAVRFRVVANTQQELDAVHQAVEDLAHEDSDTSRGIGAIRTDIRKNVVTVEVRATDRTRIEPELVQRFGDRVSVADPNAFVNDVCSNRSSCTPYRAGIQIYRSGASCTSAFLAKKNGVATYYMLTAGHCGVLNTAWFHDENQVGIVQARAYVNNGNADAEAISRAGTTGHKNWIYVTDGEMARTVTARQGHNADAAGENVCQSGITSGFFCGIIWDTDVDNVDDGTIVQNNLREATYTSAGGDSGAPVFYGHLAKGVNKGHFANGHAAYTQLWEVENALGVTVLTAAV